MRADGLDQEWVAEAAAGPGPATVWHRLFLLPVRDAATVSDITVRLARGGSCTVPRSVVQRVAAWPGGGEESFWQCVAGGGAGDEQLLSRVSWSPIGSGGEPLHSQTTLATLARTDNTPSFVLKQPPNSTEENENTEVSIPNEKQLFRDMKIGNLLGENLNSWDEIENGSEKDNMVRNRADRESIRRSLRDLKTSIKDLTELVETKNKPNGAVLPNGNGLVKHNFNRVGEHNGFVNGNLSPAAAGRERGARPSRGGGRDGLGGTGPRLLLSLKYNRTTSVVSGTFVKNATSRYSFTDF